MKEIFKSPASWIFSVILIIWLYFDAIWLNDLGTYDDSTAGIMSYFLIAVMPLIPATIVSIYLNNIKPKAVSVF